MERIHDMLGPDISVQRPLTVLFGEESAEYVWGLVAELGETGERAVMPLIEEIIRAREEILEYKDVILHLRRQLFGSKRERYIDPDQGELFPDQGAVIELRQAEEPDPPERTRRKLSNAGFAFCHSGFPGTHGEESEAAVSVYG